MMQYEFESVRDVTADVMGIEPAEIRERTRYIEDLGADSLELFEILTRLEEIHRVTFPRGAVNGVRTVGDAALLLTETEFTN